MMKILKPSVFFCFTVPIVVGDLLETLERNRDFSIDKLVLTLVRR